MFGPGGKNRSRGVTRLTGLEMILVAGWEMESYTCRISRLQRERRLAVLVGIERLLSYYRPRVPQICTRNRWNSIPSPHDATTKRQSRRVRRAYSAMTHVVRP